MKKQRSLQDTREFVARVAAHGGYRVNPDEEFTEQLVEGLHRNVERYGYYACPCRDASGDRRADRDICCPCAYNLADQAEYGQCFCALFVTAEHVSEGREVRQIPERRPEKYRT